MRLNEFGVGKIVKGVNTTPDVGVDEITKQAKKFGNHVDSTGHPPVNPSGKIKLKEAADIKWDWDFGGSFKVDRMTYVINFIQILGKENSYEFEFSPTHGSKFGNTGEMGQSSIQVFSTVMNALIEFLGKQHPDLVHFTGSIADDRGTLYTKLVNRYSSKITSLGYKIDIGSTNKEIHFNLIKQKDNYETVS
jgi:PKD repeat protein